MRSIGLDVHRDFCEVAMLDCGGGRLVRGRVATTPQDLELFAQSLAADDRVALEVTGNAWEIARILEPRVARVVVVSPADTGIRQARAKTDRLDALALAKLLAAGSLDAVWMPDERTRVMRRRLARRGQLVGARTRCKNEMHAVLVRRLKGRPPASDLFGVKGRAWLAEQRAARRGARERRWPRCVTSRSWTQRSRRSSRLIARDALNWPDVGRLMTVPGVNVIAATTFLAAVGDIRRFPSSAKLVGYLGLDPKVRQSGRRRPRHGRISKRGSSSARHALVEASWSAVRAPGPLHAFYERVRARRGYQVAIVATARKLACLFWCMLTPRRGLRLRPAIADAQEDAPPRTDCRRPTTPGRAQHLVGQQGDGPGRTRTRPAGRARLQTQRRRLESDPAGEGGRECDKGARIYRALEGLKPRGRPQPQTSALRYVSHSRPTPTIPHGGKQHHLTFIRRPKHKPASAPTGDPVRQRSRGSRTAQRRSWASR